MDKIVYYWMPSDDNQRFEWFWDIDGDFPHRPEAHGPFVTKSAAKADRAKHLNGSGSTGNGEV